jgi:hypothetical protein
VTLFSIILLMMLGGAFFVPLFVIALAMLRSARRAFVLAATFTIGATAGYCLSFLVAPELMELHMQEIRTHVLLYAFASAGAVAGGVLAVFLLSKLSARPPWQR